MKEILISGYYGFQNNGDDALLLSIVNDLKRTNPRAPIVVLSKCPAETERVYGVKAIDRFNIFSILRHMKRAGLLISGGGTLIQDATSTKSLRYYLGIIQIAKLFGVKVMLYANGIGPLINESSRRITKRILNKTELITLRDDGSQKVLDSIGVNGPKTVLTADPVFNLEISKNGEAILESIGARAPRIGISVREWKTLPKDFAEAMAEFSDYAYERYGLEPVLIPMQPSRDAEISRRIAERAKHTPAVFDKSCDIHDMLSVIGAMDVCVGMRLHTLIYAAAGSVPLIGLVYDPKISGFMNYMHINAQLPVEQVSAKKLAQLLDTTMTDYAAIKSDLSKNAAVLRKKAKLNVGYANALYEKGEAGLER